MTQSKPTRDQERAQAAYARVQSRKGGGVRIAEYKTQALHLPALIHHCGLCQALAFLEAKGAGGEGKHYFHHLLDDLASVSKLAENREKLTAAVRGAGVQEYQRMGRESMVCAEWLKRYAEALLKDQPAAPAARPT